MTTESDGVKWVELSRSDLNTKEISANSLLELSDLVEGKTYKNALILQHPSIDSSSVNLRNSCPLIVQLSPFVTGLVPYNEIIGTKALLEHGSSYLTGNPDLQAG